MYYFVFLLFVFSSRLWDRFSLRGHPPRPVHLSRSRPPSSQETQIPDPRRVIVRRNSPLPSERLGAGVPHGAAGDLRWPDCTWLHHPGPGKERHQEPEGLPEAWPLLLPGVAEVEGQLLGGTVHMYRDGKFEHVQNRVAFMIALILLHHHRQARGKCGTPRPDKDRVMMRRRRRKRIRGNQRSDLYLADVALKLTI